MVLKITAVIFMAVCIWIMVSTLFGAIAAAGKINQWWVWPVVGCMLMANAIAIVIAIVVVAKRT